MFEHPAQERGIEAARLERQVGRVGLLDGVAPLQPGHGAEVGARRLDLHVVEVDAGGVQVGEAPQQDLGLRAHAAADFQQTPGAGVVDVAEDGRLGEPGLLDQARLLGRRETVQVGEVGGGAVRVAHGVCSAGWGQAATGRSGATPAISASK